MIKVQNLVPEVYYNESRDFQLLGRIFQVLFNYTYNNAQILSKNVNSIENNNFLLDLLCTSLGFKIKEEYDVKQLNAISSIFIEILKNKGNINSIRLLVNLLLNILGIKEEITEEQIKYDDDGILNIFIPSDVLDLDLFYDVLEYTIPAGTIYNVRQSMIIEGDVKTIYKHNDTIESKLIHDSELVDRSTDVVHPNAAEKIAYFESDEVSD